ncbi:MAG: patatin-like phospholipase family protein [Anaerolineaceae bacterium]|nr:patatin-like phospholipase family protein [Anaerolineaceae bacterium]
MSEIALALGGGGIKGIAHIGVIRFLELHGFTIRAIAGTSAGGLVGAIYAAGYKVSEIEDIITGIDRGRLFKRDRHDGPSLLGLQGLTETLISVLGERQFAELKIPFACTAVDIHCDQEVILSQGSVVDALQATIAVPGVFPPKQFGAALLIDGGVLDPVPVALARWLSPNIPIIAVCLSPVPEGWSHIPAFHVPPSSPIPAPIIEQFAHFRIGQAFQIFLRSMDATSRMLAELRLQVDRPDVVIRPDVYRYGMLDNVNPQELIQAGEKAALQSLPDILKALSWPNQISRRFRRSSLPGKIVAPKDGNILQV